MSGTNKTYYHSKKALIYYLITVAIFTLITFGIAIVITLPVAIYLFIVYKKNYLEVTDKSVILHKGVLNTTELEIPLSKINNIAVRQMYDERFFKYGKVVILAGNSLLGEVFGWVDNPKEIKDVIMDLVDKS